MAYHEEASLRARRRRRCRSGRRDRRQSRPLRDYSAQAPPKGPDGLYRQSLRAGPDGERRPSLGSTSDRQSTLDRWEISSGEVSACAHLPQEDLRYPLPLPTSSTAPCFSLASSRCASRFSHAWACMCGAEMVALNPIRLVSGCQVFQACREKSTPLRGREYSTPLERTAENPGTRFGLMGRSFDGRRASWPLRLSGKFHSRRTSATLVDVISPFATMRSTNYDLSVNCYWYTAEGVSVSPPRLFVRSSTTPLSYGQGGERGVGDGARGTRARWRCMS